MFGQLAADEAFAFLFIIRYFRYILPYYLTAFLVLRKIYYRFLFFPIFSVFLHNHIGCTLQSC